MYIVGIFGNVVELLWYPILTLFGVTSVCVWVQFKMLARWESIDLADVSTSFFAMCRARQKARNPEKNRATKK